MFCLLKKEGNARRASFTTPHGVIQTPVFMNVATAGAIRGGVSAVDLASISCQVVLCNTYHLSLRPTAEIVASGGGLHDFISWQGPMLTDSGGFQVFSLSHRRKITEEGVSFQSYLDGRGVFIGPEESMRIQALLGADIAMCFDECVALPAENSYLARSVERTSRWAERCVREHERLLHEGKTTCPGQRLFGICQGGTDEKLRQRSMEAIGSMPFDGFAIGGLSVGEGQREMLETIAATVPFMPEDKPRYLMGVGTPLDILEAVHLGIDFFDCVLPLKAAQHGNVYTFSGKRRLLQKRYETDFTPIEEGCGCPACASHSRAYIRHLLKADERLGMRLCLLHNLFFYNTFMEKIRAAIEEGSFEAFYQRNRAILDEAAP